MSKMKHLLRKLHIGSGVADHPPHHPHPPPHNTSPPPPPPVLDPTRFEQQSGSTSSLSPQTTPSNSSALLPRGNDSGPGSGSGPGSADFNYFEEEFQVQLALAISVSDPDSREDPETAQIKAAQEISLGCSPLENPVEFLSLRYWNYNVVNYDEKVMDGFYDVYGINSSVAVQGKMPLLGDLKAVSVLDNVDYEVILVNRAADMELRQLEERVYFMSRECRALKKVPVTSFLVEKIADLVVNRMGGPVNDAEEVSKRWTARSSELRISLNSIILPLGCLDIGHSRHRALLFKVLADRINLPCKLVKGSYYTGTDEGAVNLIKFDNGSEYIIDLMGAPGALIPTEAPSGQLQSYAVDSVKPLPSGGTIISFPVFDTQTGTGSGSVTAAHRTANTWISREEPAFYRIEAKGDCGNSSVRTGSTQFEHDCANLLPLSAGLCDASAVSHDNVSIAQITQAREAYENVNSLADNSEVKLEGVFPESQIYLQSDLVLGVVAGKNQLPENRVVDTRQSSENNEQSLIAFTGMQFPYSISYKSDILQHKQEYTVAAPGDNTLNDTSGDKFYRKKFGNISDNNCTYKDKESATKAREMITCIQSKSYAVQKEQLPMLRGVAEWEIPWEDLHVGERIGIGSYGEVYRAEWNGTEVAVKKFMNQDITSDALAQFKCEIEIMLRLRHPNVVLFMGAVTRPPNLSILTEFLPRGSLYRLLHRANIQIDEKKRMRMALDVAKGMNYLHTSNPMIVHRDLKTPNLLVDKNWVVKVCDFGMSRLKHHTFLSSKSTAGTAEWMAPEVLRNEPSNEKSDVYSFGVILWELTTLKVPWSGMNSMQVVGAVGFQGRRLDIPRSVDLVVAEIISDCWTQNPQVRPSFAQIITRLKRLQHLNVQGFETCTDQQ
ncbi:serine/threonine-protein kinase EDR1 [Lycium barbarum]|uniref:serine/threonine-protein kinase EDR1 n=1 Tax=Lycium barbarum TaxID=112863 RepID=UPI00293E130E|nr:serine/threonine-protein kinase EDR1 [Lycium barbarum]